MVLSKAQKVLVGLLTLLPFFLIPYFIVQLFRFFLSVPELSDDPQQIFTTLLSFIGPILISAAVSLALLIFYIVHAVQHKQMEVAETIVWIVLFVFIGWLSYPVYYFLRVVPEDIVVIKKSVLAESRR